MDTFYARIKDGVVKDIIILNIPAMVPSFSVGFDYVVEVSQGPGNPGKGWTYDIISGFTNPTVPPIMFDVDISNYLENVFIDSHKSADYIVSLPLSLKTGRNVKYSPNQEKLFVTLNGQIQTRGLDFDEVMGVDGLCNSIKMLCSLEDGDVIGIRIK